MNICNKCIFKYLKLSTAALATLLPKCVLTILLDEKIRYFLILFSVKTQIILISIWLNSYCYFTCVNSWFSRFWKLSINSCDSNIDNLTSYYFLFQLVIIWIFRNQSGNDPIKVLTVENFAIWFVCINS